MYTVCLTLACLWQYLLFCWFLVIWEILNIFYHMEYILHLCGWMIILVVKWDFVYPGIILSMGFANGRRCYIITPSLVGWAHTQNDPFVPEVENLNWNACLKLLKCLCYGKNGSSLSFIAKSCWWTASEVLKMMKNCGRFIGVAHLRVSLSVWWL